jgi:hypothetical protein
VRNRRLQRFAVVCCSISTSKEEGVKLAWPQLHSAFPSSCASLAVNTPSFAVGRAREASERRRVPPEPRRSRKRAMLDENRLPVSRFFTFPSSSSSPCLLLISTECLTTGKEAIFRLKCAPHSFALFNASPCRASSRLFHFPHQHERHRTSLTTAHALVPLDCTPSTSLSRIQLFSSSTTTINWQFRPIRLRRRRAR